MTIKIKMKTNIRMTRDMKMNTNIRMTKKIKMNTNMKPIDFQVDLYFLIMVLVR